MNRKIALWLLLVALAIVIVVVFGFVYQQPIGLIVVFVVAATILPVVFVVNELRSRNRRR